MSITVATKTAKAPPPPKVSAKVPNIRSATNIHRIMGNRLRDIRLKRDMSQQSLGVVLGISFQQVQKYEKGVNRIDAARLIEIATALDCDIEDFYHGLTERRQKDGITDREIYLATPECHKLIRAMLAIKPAAVRRRLISLAETIGGINGD